ncbi:MAG TPA: DUF3618 domain-containing protein [Geminicoccaceae bacterium]|nr:DUF3618 domain-containing protein [Geminicoccaceae bacterium]
MTSYGSTARDTDPGDKSSDQIQREVESSRERIGATLDAIQERLSPGQLIDEMLNYGRRSGVGDASNHLGDMIRSNPLPLVLIGAGIAWLVMSNRSSDEDEHDDEYAGHDYAAGGSRRVHGRGAGGRDYGYDTGTHEDDGEGLASRAREAGRSAADSARRVAGRAGETASHLGETVSEYAESAKERASHLGETVSGYSESVRRRASHLGETVGEYAESARERAGQARRVAQRGRDAFDDMLGEHPLVLGGIGVALGAVLGAVLPTTERENELLGPARDRLKDEAMSAGGEAWETAKEMASDAAREAEETLTRKLDEAEEAVARKIDETEEAAVRKVEQTGAESKGEQDPLGPAGRPSTVRL